TAAAVSRLAGSATMFSFGKFRSNLRTAFSCSAFVRIRVRARGMRPSKRAYVSSSRVLSETRRRSCLGRARRLNGQKRSPLPPASMSAYIESGMLVQAGSRRENCRFFFQNATYMVGDVFPDIHFKNFRASGSGPTAYADPHRDWPGL